MSGRELLFGGIAVLGLMAWIVLAASKAQPEDVRFFRVQSAWLVASPESGAHLRCTATEASATTVSYSCCDLRKLGSNAPVANCKPDFFATVTAPSQQGADQ